MNKYKKLILNISQIILMIIIFYFIYKIININNLKSVFANGSYNYLSQVVLLSFIYIVVESILFFNIAKQNNIELKLLDSFFLTNITYLFNMLVPLSGMTLRALYLKKFFDTTFKTYLKIILQFIILEVFVCIIFLIIFSLIRSNFSIDIGIYFFCIVLILFLIFLLHKIFKKIFRIKNFSLLFLNTLLLTSTYIFIVYFVFKLFNHSNFYDSTFLALILSISNYVSITPGSYGVFEGVSILASNYLNLFEEEGLAISFVIRLSFILVIIVPSIFYLKKTFLFWKN